MRKLKLQMQVTVDGFVAGPEGQLDWMSRAMDQKLIGFITHLTDTSDTILLGRKMTQGFVDYWEGALAKAGNPESPFAQKMVDYPKIAFSRTQSDIKGKNLRVERGDMVKAVQQLKGLDGKDIVVYGGATFVSSLIDSDLIDEYNFFINPTAIGTGMQVFKARKPLKLKTSTAYSSGIVVNTYESA